MTDDDFILDEELLVEAARFFLAQGLSKNRFLKEAAQAWREVTGFSEVKRNAMLKAGDICACRLKQQKLTFGFCVACGKPVRFRRDWSDNDHTS